MHSTSSVTPWIPSEVSPQTNSCPRMVWATFFVLHCVNHSHGTSPKKVPRGGGSCHISPARITFNPPKGRAYAASFAYLPWARSRTSSRQRNSNRAKSSALTMLISSMMSHRQRNALALRSRSLCPLMRSSPRPCQFKPNAWWIVSPFKSLAITACSVTTWNSSPCFQPKYPQTILSGDDSIHTISLYRVHHAQPTAMALAPQRFQTRSPARLGFFYSNLRSTDQHLKHLRPSFSPLSAKPLQTKFAAFLGTKMTSGVSRLGRDTWWFLQTLVLLCKPCVSSHTWLFFACMVGEGIYIYVGSCATSYSPG